jgi:hypothetical protein
MTTDASLFVTDSDSGGPTMESVAHRQHAIRDQIVDREIRRLELLQRARREAGTVPSPPAPPPTPPDRR